MSRRIDNWPPGYPNFIEAPEGYQRAIDDAVRELDEWTRRTEDRRRKAWEDEAKKAAR